MGRASFPPRVVPTTFGLTRSRLSEEEALQVSRIFQVWQVISSGLLCHDVYLFPHISFLFRSYMLRPIHLRREAATF